MPAYTTAVDVSYQGIFKGIVCLESIHQFAEQMGKDSYDIIRENLRQGVICNDTDGLLLVERKVATKFMLTNVSSLLKKGKKGIHTHTHKLTSTHTHTCR